MNLSGIVPLLEQVPAYCTLLATEDSRPQALLHAVHPAVIAGIARERSGPVVFLTARSEMAIQLADRLEAWLPIENDETPSIYLFAEPDALPYERISWSSETRQRRLTALAALQSRASQKRQPIIIVSARSLMQKTLPPKELRLSLRPLKTGGIVRLE